MPPRPRREGAGQGGPADPTALATRGRRSNEIAALMAQDDDPLTPEVEGEDFLADDTEVPTGLVQADLLPGDVIAAKVVAQIDVGDQSAWVTMGVQSQVQPGEDEQDAMERVIGVVASRFEDLAAEAEERITNQRNQWNADHRPRR